MRALVKSGTATVFTPMLIEAIQENEDGLIIQGVYKGEPFSIDQVDEIIANTGASPNFDRIKEIRYAADSALECVPELTDLIDPNIHSCGTVSPHGEKELRQPEKDFYIIGAKSYGRAPTFLMATGYEQARSVVAYLTGDFEAAERVELNLPETGVCSSGIALRSCCAEEETPIKLVKDINISSCGCN